MKNKKNKLILIVNAGSSSMKFKLFDEKLNEIVSGIAERISQRSSFIVFNDKKKKIFIKNHEQALKKFFEFIKAENINLKNIEKVGHRYVHGGENFYKPTLITENNLKSLEKLNNLAPLHNPHNLAGVKACIKLLKFAKNYACFDTAYFHNLPEKVKLYPIPMYINNKYNIRKYGFHGLSHEFVAEKAAEKLKKRKNQLNLITCHLGSGCSISAIEKGEPIDTSMGFTPLEGLMMSTRSGDIDPAIPIYLINKKLKPKAVEKTLNNQSGLFGISGYKDMRDILTAAGYKIPGYHLKKKPSAEQKLLSNLALEMFIYRIKKYIGSYQAILKKVDAVVFTAGIGERSPQVRNLIVKGLPNKPKTLIIQTNEELMMAKLII